MKVIKRWATIIIGGLVLAAGVMLIPVPGPGGLPVTLAGLAILSSELPWAHRFLERLKQRVPWTRSEPLGVQQRWWRIGIPGTPYAILSPTLREESDEHDHGQRRAEPRTAGIGARQ
jgi:hypothetical protein